MQKNKAEVEYQESVVMFFNELIDALYYNNYFGFIDSAKQYVTDMRNYIDQNICNTPKYPAPPYFNKYGNAMHYITYISSKRTTWYIFFQQKVSRYLIRYITNNHKEGQFIR